MKRLFPWIVLILSAFWLASECRVPKPKPGEFDLVAFGKTPVLVGGRLKPLDTVARNSLVIIRGKQTLLTADGKSLGAMRWLADVMFNAPVADKYPAFVINNPDVLGSFGWEQGTRKYFSFAELKPFLAKIDEQGSKADGVESAKRTPFQTAIYNLRNSIVLYQRLKNSLEPEDTTGFTAELDEYAKGMPAGLEANSQREKGTQFDKTKLDSIAKYAARYEKLAEMSYILAIPPAHELPGMQPEWISAGTSLLQAISTREINPVVKLYAQIGDAWNAGDAAAFNQHTQELSGWMASHEFKTVGRANFEFLFNHIAPFYQAMQLYVLAFLLVLASWLCFGEWSRSLGRAAVFVLLLALAVHTFGLIARMYLQGRPPVTNLYSSAIFIGWGTVIIGLILERFFRDGIGSACAAIIGFVTLIIAHHLAASGDTLEMLQAVLDTNIWLATHVVVVTLGYSAMFFAGLLAIFYVVLGVFTQRLSEPLSRSTAIIAGTATGGLLGAATAAAATTGQRRPEPAAKVLSRMVYGVICFATLFSFVGTVLGGIWADQSWGRFWGWDPKENGALLIVLWCAVILHARWGGFIRDRGLMILVLFGNVITSFSWFGVNMLGVGLHSYGFMDKAFPWLMGFVISQLFLMAVASLPVARWRSFRPQL
jgi:cytochrome c-type biogenesis protein CcsB